MQNSENYFTFKNFYSFYPRKNPIFYRKFCFFLSLSICVCVCVCLKTLPLVNFIFLGYYIKDTPYEGGRGGEVTNFSLRGFKGPSLPYFRRVTPCPSPDHLCWSISFFLSFNFFLSVFFFLSSFLSDKNEDNNKIVKCTI